MDSDDEQELLQYREKVIAELERRAIRLREIEQQISELQGVLEATGRGRRVMMGGAARIQVEAAHKAKLKQVLRGLYHDKEIALADLQKAETRLQDVETQLDELQGSSREVE